VKLKLKLPVVDVLMTAGFELSKFRSNVSLGQDECLDYYGRNDFGIIMAINGGLITV